MDLPFALALPLRKMKGWDIEAPETLLEGENVAISRVLAPTRASMVTVSQEPPALRVWETDSTTTAGHALQFELPNPDNMLFDAVSLGDSRVRLVTCPKNGRLSQIEMHATRFQGTVASEGTGAAWASRPFGHVVLEALESEYAKKLQFDCDTWKVTALQFSPSGDLMVAGSRAEADSEANGSCWLVSVQAQRVRRAFATLFGENVPFFHPSFLVDDMKNAKFNRVAAVLGHLTHHLTAAPRSMRPWSCHCASCSQIHQNPRNYEEQPLLKKN
jgi:hypothetical protein